jgi:hypothetical protein
MKRFIEFDDETPQGKMELMLAAFAGENELRANDKLGARKMLGDNRPGVTVSIHDDGLAVQLSSRGVPVGERQLFTSLDSPESLFFALVIKFAWYKLDDEHDDGRPDPLSVKR